jgi:hypothetical protein
MNKKFFGIGLFAVLAAACGDKSSEAPAAPAAKPVAAQPAAPVAAPAVPTDADPAALAALKKVSSCKWGESGLDDDCKWDDEFDKFQSKYVEIVKEGDTEVDMVKQGKLAHLCLAFVADADPRLRHAGIQCVSATETAIDSEKPVVELILSRLAAETDVNLQDDLAHLLQNVEPANVGLGARAVALLPKFKDNQSIALSLLDASWSPDVDPPAEAFDLAVSIASANKARPVASHAVKVMVRVKPRAADACKQLAAWATGGDAAWRDGVSGIGQMGDACKANLDAAVAVTVDKLNKDNDSLSSVDFVQLRELAKDKALSKDQKAKLATAAKGLEARTKNDTTKFYVGELVKSLA